LRFQKAHVRPSALFLLSVDSDVELSATPPQCLSPCCDVPAMLIRDYTPENETVSQQQSKEGLLS
jgi:NADH:ubiquinone oxidoreductase subunit E